MFMLDRHSFMFMQTHDQKYPLYLRKRQAIVGDLSRRVPHLERARQHFSLTFLAFQILHLKQAPDCRSVVLLHKPAKLFFYWICKKLQVSMSEMSGLLTHIGLWCLNISIIQEV